MQGRLKQAARFIPAALMLALLAGGAWLVRNSDSRPALTWMFIYEPTDFLGASARDILAFFKNLMIPIPPLVGLAEILSVKLVGSALLVTRYGYRLALVGSFAAALWLANTSLRRALAAFGVSGLFLFVTTLVHPGNPQNYDFFFALAFLLFLIALRRASRTDGWLMPVLAGFLLSMTELTRPFVIFLLPLLLAGAFAMLWQPGQTRRFLLFLIPVLIISGGWHAYLAAAHGQLTFSNNSAFNVARAWPQIPAPPLIPEPGYVPLAESKWVGVDVPQPRWGNLNTPEHTENNRRMQRAELAYWVAHPVDSALFAVDRMATFLSGATAYNKFTPVSRWFGLYAIVERTVSGLAILGASLVLFSALFHPRQLLSILAQPDNLTLLFLAACIIILAVGEMDEEPRLLLSVLPLLATLPVWRLPRLDPAAADPAFTNTGW